MSDILDDPDLALVLADEAAQRADEQHLSMAELLGHARRSLSERDHEEITAHLVHCDSCRALRLGLEDLEEVSPGRRALPWVRYVLHPAVAWSLAIVMVGVLVYALRAGNDRREPGVPEALQLVELAEDSVVEDVLGAVAETGVRPTVPAHVLLVTGRVGLQEPLPVAVASAEAEVWRGVASPRRGFPGQFTTVVPALSEGDYRVVLEEKGEVVATFRFTVETPE